MRTAIRMTSVLVLGLLSLGARVALADETPPAAPVTCGNDTVGQPCDDGLACTDSDTCFGGGVCGGFFHCDDGDPCTADSCGDGPDGCVNVYDANACGPNPNAMAECPVVVELPLEPEDPNQLTGAGCACRAADGRGGSSGASGAWLLAPLALLAVRARRRRRADARMRTAVALAAGALVLAVAGVAAAQGNDIQIFRPATSTTGFISQDDVGVLPGLRVNLALTMDVADRTLVVRDAMTNAPIADVIGRRSTVHVGAGMGLGHGLEIGADLPLIVEQQGDMSYIDPSAQLAEQSAGDLRLRAKLKLRGGRFGVTGVAALTVPTGSGDDFAGGSTTFTESLVGGGTFGRVSLAVNVGYRFRSQAQLGGVDIGDEVVAGAGGSYALDRDRLWLIGEAYAAAGVSGSGPASAPAEAVAGARWRVAGPWVVQAAAGFGLTTGYGTPGVRGVVGVSWSPTVAAKRWKAPAAPRLARAERVANPAKPQPLIAPEAPEVRDADGDGIVDAADQCPGRAEDGNGVQDGDGCPELDTDQDGLADRDDACPHEAEIVNGVDDADGCADDGLFAVIDDRLVLDERVLFATDSARVLQDGVPVLSAVVEMWEQHPEWDRLVLEGHTDLRGSDEHNEELGMQRAESVRRALILLGMPADRIEVVSYGKQLPCAEGHTAADLQRNRRVEFVFVRGAHGPRLTPSARAAE